MAQKSVRSVGSVRKKKPPRCISAGGGSVYPHRGGYARVLISIMNQTHRVTGIAVVSASRGVHS